MPHILVGTAFASGLIVQKGGMRMHSALAKLYPDVMNEEELRDVKRRAWQEHGILVVRADEDGLNWLDQEQVKQLGDKLYGKRG